MSGDNLPVAGESTSTDKEKWPVGFMLTIVLVVLYLGWRLVQGIGWLIEQL